MTPVSDQNQICCYICCIRAQETIGTSSRKSIVTCPKCGTYKIGLTTKPVAADSNGPLGEWGGRLRSHLSSWMRSRTLDDTEPITITNYFLRNQHDNELANIFWSTPFPSFNRKADLLLLAIESKTKYAGDVIDFRGNLYEWIAVAWAINQQEFNEILTFLIGGTNRLRYRRDLDEAPGDDDHYMVQIRPEGWAHLEQIHKKDIKSDQGFVAMQFSQGFRRLYTHGIEPAIWAAGYHPFRIDQEGHINRIDDEIEVQIKKSKFMVADVTSENSGVIYEMGYARGLNLPTILTRKHEELSGAHFDFRQINTLSWDTLDDLEDFAGKLSFRIKNNCGQGPVVPPSGILELLRDRTPQLFP